MFNLFSTFSFITHKTQPAYAFCSEGGRAVMQKPFKNSGLSVWTLLAWGLQRSPVEHRFQTMNRSRDLQIYRLAGGGLRFVMTTNNKTSRNICHNKKHPSATASPRPRIAGATSARRPKTRPKMNGLKTRPAGPIGRTGTRSNLKAGN